MNLTLARDYQDAELTLGLLSVEDLILDTLEPPWVPDANGGPGGTPLLSCVPPGIYTLVLHDSVKHPKTFVLVNEALGIYANPTPGKRCDVLIHSGNVEEDTEGCIVLGCSRGTLAGESAVLESAKAFAQFRDAVPWVPGHTLTIVGVP